MNKIVTLIILFLLGGCKVNSQNTGNKVNSPSYKSDSIIRWGNYKLDESIMPLSEVKNKYLVKGGKLYNRFENSVVSDITIQFITDGNEAEDVYIKNGVPINSYYEKKHNIMDWRLINYSETGNLNGVFVVANYETQFKNGFGIWKNYYYKNFKSLSEASFQLREEGEVKNNFKIGEWKYYNKEGKLEKTKTYTLNDSIDVRFPQCIFNNTEPCN